MRTEVLLTQLENYCKTHKEFVDQAMQRPLEELNFKSNDESWSVLECIEHLNRYGNYYLPEIESRLGAKKSTHREFSPGWLGDYFAKSMLPSESMKTMKTFRSMNPAGSRLDSSVLNEFGRQMDQMLDLLKEARGSDLNTIRIPISLTPLIRLKLGDTFRFVIYHNERHVQQAKRNFEYPATSI